ncbi:hypothetical protein FO519_006581 [Halicephalobus sp. NKZ332]|nr:hypothetical protein FO519_006581 [Halicephalobus sp. NKZ332]
MTAMKFLLLAALVAAAVADQANLKYDSAPTPQAQDSAFIVPQTEQESTTLAQNNYGSFEATTLAQGQDSTTLLTQDGLQTTAMPIGTVEQTAAPVSADAPRGDRPVQITAAPTFSQESTPAAQTAAPTGLPQGQDSTFMTQDGLQTTALPQGSNQFAQTTAASGLPQGSNDQFAQTTASSLPQGQDPTFLTQDGRDTTPMPFDKNEPTPATPAPTGAALRGDNTFEQTTALPQGSNQLPQGSNQFPQGSNDQFAQTTVAPAGMMHGDESTTAAAIQATTEGSGIMNVISRLIRAIKDDSTDETAVNATTEAITSTTEAVASTTEAATSTTEEAASTTEAQRVPRFARSAKATNARKTEETTTMKADKEATTTMKADKEATTAATTIKDDKATTIAQADDAAITSTDATIAIDDVATTTDEELVDVVSRLILAADQDREKLASDANEDADSIVARLITALNATTDASNVTESTFISRLINALSQDKTGAVNATETTVKATEADVISRLVRALSENTTDTNTTQAEDDSEASSEEAVLVDQTDIDSSDVDSSEVDEMISRLVRDAEEKADAATVAPADETTIDSADETTLAAEEATTEAGDRAATDAAITSTDAAIASTDATDAATTIGAAAATTTAASRLSTTTRAGSRLTTTTKAPRGNGTCTAQAVCYGDHECGEKGRCLGLFVGKCNCNACLNFLTCKDDSACGGLQQGCNTTSSRCNCIEGYKANGFPLFIDALRELCNVKDCDGKSTDACFGLPCNHGRCVC